MADLEKDTGGALKRWSGAHSKRSGRETLPILSRSSAEVQSPNSQVQVAWQFPRECMEYFCLLGNITITNIAKIKGEVRNWFKSALLLGNGRTCLASRYW